MGKIVEESYNTDGRILCNYKIMTSWEQRENSMGKLLPGHRNDLVLIQHPISTLDHHNQV